MTSYFLTFSFIFGAIIGSFLNVVSLRFNTGKGLGGRSRCMSCGKELKWFELIPVISFLVQMGKCSKCKSKISWQYPIVELLTGTLFAFIFFSFPPLSFTVALTTLVQLIVACLLVVITVYDTKHKIIPNSFVYTFDAITFLNLFVGGTSIFHTTNIWSILAGPIIALPFAFLWLISKGKWMGFGDVKLALGIGWLLGINAGINAVILAFWIGAIVSVAWLIITHRKFKPKTEIPLGPYLIIGMYVVLFFGVRVIDLEIIRQILLSSS